MAVDGVVPCAEGYDMWSYSCPTCKFRLRMVEARAASNSAVPERRLVSRHGVTKTGTIEFDDGATSCVVRDVSAAGAAVSLTSRVPIPEHFVLVADGSHLRCYVIWRQKKGIEKRIGVAFI
jgi:PilZ domain